MTENRARENDDPLCLSDEAAADLLRSSPWTRYAVMGDSFAEGIGGPLEGYATVPWPERVANALRAGRGDLAYLNTGKVGLRTPEVRATQLDRVLAFRPDLVHVATGGNDLFVPKPDLDAIEAELDSIYTALRAQDAHIVVFTVANVFDAHPAMAEFRARVSLLNDRIRAVAGRHEATLVEMWDHPVRTHEDLMSADRIHFSMLGHAVLASEVIKALAGASVQALARTNQA